MKQYWNYRYKFSCDSSQGSNGGSGDGEDGGGGSNILSLLTGLLGSSSGVSLHLALRTQLTSLLFSGSTYTSNSISLENSVYYDTDIWMVGLIFWWRKWYLDSNSVSSLYHFTSTQWLFRVKTEGRGFHSRWYFQKSHWYNPWGRTVVLGSTQVPTEMNTRNISWG